MGRIRLLDETTASQIAAGEVVERPASVLKELVENAIDAGASRIAVAIEHGGKTRVRVEDDGSGIAAEDAALAFERHATSKLASAADLARVRTRGFRGEALAAIASVARVEMVTLASGEREGTRIAIAGGKIAALEPAPAAPGTVVDVRDLFFNVPARLKFLKSTGAETAAAAAAFLRQALAHPGLSWRFTSGGKEEWNLPAQDGVAARAGQLFGAERVASWLEARRDGAGLRLHALLEPPDRHHPTRSEQMLFVNRRPIVDRGLQHAIQRGYEGLLPAGRFPAVIVFLEADDGLVDVNVHPAKAEVRFADPGAVQALVAAGLREALARSGFVPGLRASLHAEGVREAVASYLDRAAAAAPGGGRSYTIRPAGPAAAGATRSAPAGGEPPAPAPAPPRGPAPAARVLGQFRRTFLVCEDERGLLLVDQHTAHERVLFERLVASAAVRTPGQGLLLPEVVELGAGEAATLRAGLGELEGSGIEVEPLGGTAFAVRALPAGLKPGGAGALLRAVVEALAADRGFEAALGARERVLATVACHAAVKRHMPLEGAEMERLLADLGAARDPYRCPHGRATMQRFDAGELLRSFGRYW